MHKRKNNHTEPSLASAQSLEAETGDAKASPAAAPLGAEQTKPEPSQQQQSQLIKESEAQRQPAAQSDTAVQKALPTPELELVEEVRQQPTAKPDPVVEMFRKQRITQTVSLSEPGKKLLEMIPVRKPAKEIWVRTHPDIHNYWYRAPIIELKDSNEVYFLAQEVFEALSSIGEKMVTMKYLALTCNRNQIITFWPLGLPGEDGKFNPWHESALSAAVRARKSWIRLVADRSLGAYQIHERLPDKVEPHWPNLPIEELLKIAFRGKIIDSLDHPVVRELRGQPTDNVSNANEALERLLGKEK